MAKLGVSAIGPTSLELQLYILYLIINNLFDNAARILDTL